MNDTLLLLQMIQNGDLGAGSSSLYIKHANHQHIFYNIDRQINNGEDDSMIDIPFPDDESDEDIYLFIRNELSKKDVKELWNTSIVLYPITSSQGEVENQSRPIVLSHFIYDSENGSRLVCDFEFFGKSFYWFKPDEEGYEFTGTIKGIACFTYEGGLNSDNFNFNTCTLDVSYGILQYTFVYKAVE